MRAPTHSVTPGLTRGLPKPPLEKEGRPRIKSGVTIPTEIERPLSPQFHTFELEHGEASSGPSTIDLVAATEI